MNIEKLYIIPSKLIEQYLSRVSKELVCQFLLSKDAETSTNNFSYYTAIAAITSSRIEGEQMEVDSYVKHRMLDIEYQPDLVQKPDDLYNAYLYAQANGLSQEHFSAAHKLITAHLLPAQMQGVVRTGNMMVMEHNTGRIQFEAPPADQVKELYSLLWEDIELLKKQELTTEQVFYFASFIHLAFVMVHPFEDGNGRAGRLLEKWFIAEKLGSKAWFIQSELNYYKQVNEYYRNLNRLGIFYEELDYSKALPFLLMLPAALSQ